ncbi:MAG: TonB-dependent receptor [Chitinophagaceae bacterium]|nr:TonB-dependent receptor [Chitinophagaceae bacterium]
MRTILIVCALLTGQTVSAQQYWLTVHVTDSANILQPNTTLSINKKLIVVDSSSVFISLLEQGKYKIKISAVGYHSIEFAVNLMADTILSVKLNAKDKVLQGVMVTANRTVHRNQMSTQVIGITQLKKIPVILGEIDPLKTITLLPGIKSGGDASAGIYVRGGGPDQNLVLLDGITVYNPNHLLGFFSVFNGEAVKSVEVIKGGIPAEYGGRLSSVITVNSRDGNKDSVKASGGIGLLSSRLSLEGPLVKGKSSFIISARRTYVDQLAKTFVKDSIGNNGYYFYDINAKANFYINSNNNINFTFYKGSDKFTYVNKEDIGKERMFDVVWGNAITGLSWKQQLNANLKQELSLIYNNFNIDSRINFGASGFIFSSGLSDYQVKNDWTYSSNTWLKWKWGLQYIWHNFKPGAGASNSGMQEFKSQISDRHAREAAAYLSTDINITSSLNIIAGIRYSYFNQVGPTEQKIYTASGVPTGETQQYEKGESIAKYHYPEPRISALYKLGNDASLRLSYARTIQYLHLATTSAATFPSDLWTPASKLIKPGNAQQVAAGYFKELKNGSYELSVEAYYKTMSNQLEFKPGARLLLNQNIENEMIFGAGKAYGIEFFLQKKTGKLTGWIGYTLSRAERKFPDMNEGKTFPYRYDRTHDLSIVANYPLGKKWETSAVFVYGTGNAVTMPTGRFAYNIGRNAEKNEVMFTNINQYDKINDYRMPAYHRMDISFIYTPKPNSTKQFRSSWNFSVYNVYNRYNPYFIYMTVDEEEKTIKGKKVFLFPVVPSVTWNFKF